MTEPPPEGPSGDVIDRLRQLWVAADEESIRRDIVRARGLAETAAPHRRAEAEDFVVALGRLERWLRDF